MINSTYLFVLIHAQIVQPLVKFVMVPLLHSVNNVIMDTFSLELHVPQDVHNNITLITVNVKGVIKIVKHVMMLLNV